jgi:putative transcriptional regulator
MQSLQGKLLVSSPALIDPNFRKTVVLIAHHDDEGAMGLVLSRPSSVTAAEAVPALDGLVGPTDPVFVGGPVQPEAFMALAEFDDLADAAAPIFGRVGFMPAESEPDELSVRRVRLFAGYAGWGPGQLEDEVEDGSWYVVPGEALDAFRGDTAALRRDVLRRQPGALAWHSTRPVDPELN